MLRGPSARLGGGGCSFPGRGFLLAVAWAGGPWGRVLWGRGAVGSGWRTSGERGLVTEGTWRTQSDPLLGLAVWEQTEIGRASCRERVSSPV